MAERTVNDHLFNLTIKHHVNIHRLAQGAIRDALKRLGESDAQIVEVLSRLLDGEGNPTPTRVDRLLRTVKNINDRAYRDVRKEVVRQLSLLAEYEGRHVTGQLVNNSLPFDWQLAKPKRSQLRAILHEQPMSGGNLDEWFQGMADARYNKMRMTIRQGVAAGESSSSMIKALRGTRALNRRDGVFDRSRRSMAQTLGSYHNHVANHARLTAARKNKDMVEGIFWTAILDDITCERCAGLDNEVLPLDTYLAPPLHPNCRCVATLILAPDDVFADIEDIDPFAPTPQKRKLGGMPRRLSYQEWLDEQDEETQKDILGEDKHRMLKMGMSVKKFSDASGRALTLAQLKQEVKKMAPPKAAPVIKRSVVRRRNFGYKPDLPDFRDKLFGVEEPKELQLPPRVTLRDKMPPVWDQGPLGACTAFSIISCLMFALGPKTPQLSFLDLYFKERLIEGTVDEDAGAEIRDGIKALAKWGVATADTWPYKIRNYRQPPPKEAAAEDQTYQIKKYMRLKGHEDYMRCLAMGYPFVIGFSVYDNYDDDPVVRNGVLATPFVTNKLIGGHAVAVVGYDTAFHESEVFKNSGLDKSQIDPLAYEVRNSYGPEFGDDGHFWVAASYFDNKDLADDAWTIRT